MPKCPCHQEYVFREKCVIETCQHHTKVTQHNCLSLDRREGDRPPTIAEIGYYKEYALARIGKGVAPLTPKGIETASRRTLMRIREATRVLQYLCYLDETAVDRSETVLSELAVQFYKDLQFLFHNELRLWMIPFLFNKECIIEFSRHRKGMSAEEFNFRLVLGKNTKLNTSNQLKEIYDEFSSSK